MSIETTFPHNKCFYYIAEYHIEYQHISPSKGDYYIGKEYAYNTLAFILDGEVEFSYNKYSSRRFHKGDMVFIPHTSHIYWEAITDANMLIHTYDLPTEIDNSNSFLSKVKFKTERLEKISYNFQALKMTPEVTQFAELMIIYLMNSFKCTHLNELKQKELFIIMQHVYSYDQIMGFFYPILK